MKNYSDMSDFEINLEVAHLILGKGGYDWDSEHQEVYRDSCMGSKFDPCNYPYDAWPIIVENRIKIDPVTRCRNYNEIYRSWEASVSGRIYFEENKNTLRAAMIVYLMMKDADKC